MAPLLAANTAVTNEGSLPLMRLNPPSMLIFLISVVLAALALITKLGVFFPVPRYIPHQEYWLAITAYMVLMLGSLVRGL